MSGSFKDRIRAHNDPENPTPEQRRKSKIKDDMKRIRAALHSALMAMNQAESQWNNAVTASTSEAETETAFDQFESALQPFLEAIKSLPKAAGN